MAGQGTSASSRFGAAALLLAASVLLSRLLGYARDLLLANLAGAGVETDAYFVAFLVPDLLNYLLAGGALAIAFVPFYSRVREERGEEAAGELFATVLGTSGAVVIAATALLWVVAPQIVDSQLTRFDPATRELTVRLTRIVLPAQIFFVTGGILRAVLMAHGRFREQALAPLLYNGAILVGGAVAGGVEGFAWGVLVGAFAGNWLVPVAGMLRVRPVRVRLAFFSADLARYLWIAAPLMLGVSLTTVDEWYEKYLGAALAPGSVAALSFARKLFMVPVGVIGQALGAAALPILAELVARGRAGELEAVLGRALRVAIGLGALAAVGLIVFSSPLVVLLYEHGRFGADASRVVAGLLAWMAWATPAWVVQQVAVRAFYAREDTWRPMGLGTVVALAVLPLYLWLREARGVEGLAIAGVVAMTLNAAATLVWARVRHGTPRLVPLALSGLRAVVIAAVAGAVGHAAGTWGALLGGGEGRLAAISALVVGGGGFGLAASLALVAVGDPALRETVRARLPGAGARG